MKNKQKLQQQQQPQIHEQTNEKEKEKQQMRKKQNKVKTWIGAELNNCHYSNVRRLLFQYVFVALLEMDPMPIVK